MTNPRMDGFLRRQINAVFQPLHKSDMRHEGAYGGRGSGKSHFIAEECIEDALDWPGRYGGEGLRLLCVREYQKSLKQSAKKLLEMKINHWRLGNTDGIRIYDDRIKLPKDGVIEFTGMQDHTADSVKSYEGFQIAWVEEAQTISDFSLKLLRPTIRAPGSKIRYSWNPRRAIDPVELLRHKPPTRCVTVEANWRHNRWFTRELEEERRDCKRDDPDDYEHTWEGGYATTHKGAYFAHQLKEARKWRRICELSKDPYLTLHAFFDLGGTGQWSDAFTCWIVQFVGDMVHLLDYYEVNSQEFSAHLDWMKNMGYGPDQNVAIWLPHDGEQNERMYDNNFAKGFKKAGYRNVTVVPNQGKGAARSRIAAGRKVFPFCKFNNAPKPLLPGGVIIAADDDRTKAGRDALGFYHERVDTDRNVGLGPEHDWSSHGSDAFGLMAICRERIMKTTTRPKTKVRQRSVKDAMIGL